MAPLTDLIGGPPGYVTSWRTYWWRVVPRAMLRGVRRGWREFKLDAFIGWEEPNDWQRKALIGWRSKRPR